MRARELLSQTVYDYYAGGANDEITLRDNRAAYERIALLPRVLVDVSVRHMGTTVLHEHVSMPILIALTSFQGLAHPEGELAWRSILSADSDRYYIGMVWCRARFATGHLHFDRVSWPWGDRRLGILSTGPFRKRRPGSRPVALFCARARGHVFDCALSLLSLVLQLDCSFPLLRSQFRDARIDINHLVSLSFTGRRIGVRPFSISVPDFSSVFCSSSPDVDNA